MQEARAATKPQDVVTEGKMPVYKTIRLTLGKNKSVQIGEHLTVTNKGRKFKKGRGCGDNTVYLIRVPEDIPVFRVDMNDLERKDIPQSQS